MRINNTRVCAVAFMCVVPVQMVLKVSAPTDWGLQGAAGPLDSSAVEQECWYPGQDSFAQVN